MVKLVRTPLGHNGESGEYPAAMTFKGVPLRLLLGLGMIAALAACTKDNPDYCDGDGDCDRGLKCQKNLCAPPPDTGVGSGGRGGSGGSASTGGTGGGGELTTSDVAIIDSPGDANEVSRFDGGACGEDKDCASGVCVNNHCVECRSPAPGMPSPQCKLPTKAFCRNGACVGCGDLMTTPSTPACVAPTPNCNTSGACVECNTSADCREPTKPICSPDFKCVACTAGGPECAAKNAALPICQMDGHCDECGKSADCKMPAAPACVMAKCVACTTDQQCVENGVGAMAPGPGLCLTDPDGKNGRCATEEETIFVGQTGCSDGGKGTSAQPFCSPQKGLDAVTASKRVVVIRGPDAHFGINVGNKGAMPVHVIGVNGAIIAPGVNPGILADQAVDLRVRGLTIRGSNSFGVQAKGNAIVRLNRCIIKSNGQGGLSVSDGAGFDVSNCVFDGNGGNGPSSGAIGAAALVKPTAANRPARFRASTLVDNVNGAVSCSPAQSMTLAGLILKGNESTFGCQLVEECTGDPMFSPTVPYHLQEGSHCRNKASTGSMPWDDIDGQLRGANPNGMTDSGADDVP